MIKKREAIEILVRASRAADALSITTMQAVPVWHAVAGASSNEPAHVDMLGCMGAASSFGLGLALGKPDRKVMVIDGDGCVMMQLGTLVTIGQARPKNFLLVIMHNKFYETSGNQPIPGAETADFVAMARGAGFPAAHRFADVIGLKRAMEGIMRADGPTLLVLDIEREDPTSPFDWPKLSMKDQIQALRDASA